MSTMNSTAVLYVRTGGWRDGRSEQHRRVTVDGWTPVDGACDDGAREGARRRATARAGLQ